MKTVSFFRPSARGFTLIELLVVISIISLLISILLPALAKARATATLVQCASTEHGLLIGLSGYCANSRGWLPPQNTSSGSIYVDYFYLPATSIMYATSTRWSYAGNSPYGNYQGLGHVIGGGYCSNDADNLVGLFEPTKIWSWHPNFATPVAYQTYQSNAWKTYQRSSNGGGAAAEIGYCYRGWSPFAVVDGNAHPNIDEMGTKAAIWDNMVTNAPPLLPETHNDGYQVGHYDGHVSYFSDPFAAITYSLGAPYSSQFTLYWLQFDKK